VCERYCEARTKIMENWLCSFSITIFCDYSLLRLLYLPWTFLFFCIHSVILTIYLYCSHSSMINNNCSLFQLMHLHTLKYELTLTFIYLSISGPTTAVAIFRNPNTIPFCLTTDLLHGVSKVRKLFLFLRRHCAVLNRRSDATFKTLKNC
jgi:hypothetical protein